MKLSSLDEVAKLRNYRRKTIDLRDAAKSGLIECACNRLDVFAVVPDEPVRNAIVAACDREIAEYEAQLATLGVEIA